MPEVTQAKTIREVIDLAGGRHAVATNCNITTFAVDRWVQANIIPAKYWKTLIDLAGGDLTADILLQSGRQVRHG